LKRSRTYRLSIFLAVLLALFATATIAKPESAAVASGPTAGPGQEKAFVDNSPLAVAIRQIQQDARERVTALQNRANSGASLQPGPDVQRQITQIKTDTEIAILEAILADAQAHGDAPRITAAEGALDRMRHPENYQTSLVPVVRPAPLH